MKTFKDLVNEVAQPLSQGEKNFKALHGSVEAVNRDMVPGVTDQDHVFKGLPHREDPRTASYETQDESEAQYDKTLKVAESVEDIEEEYKDPDKHYAKQSKKMQDAINLHLRKGKTYWEAVRASKVHVKEGWVALGPATKPGEKTKPMFNNLGNPNPGTKIYGDMPKMKASGRGNRSATDIKGMREETINEKTLTPAEMKKREEIVKAIKRGNKGMDKSMAYAIATKTAKRVAEDYDMDYEGEMAKAELNAIADKAAILADMLDNDTQLEAWLQSKITKAKYMIDSVHDYMMYTDHEADNNNAPSQSDAMASNYGSFLNRMGEEVERVDESKEGYNTWYNRGRSYRERTKAAQNFSMANVTAMIRDEKARKEKERKEAEKKMAKEETEQLDELSKKTLGNYIKKSTEKVHKSSFMAARDKPENAAKHGMDAYKRIEGIRKATDRLTKEELELDEARRGRPRKDGTKPEGEEDGGREHIIMQLRKVVNLRGQKKVEFNDDSKHDIDVAHAKKALAKHDLMHKAADKQAYAERLAKSHGSFKSAVSEAVDPTTMKSDRGNLKPFVRQDKTGKFVVGKRREGRKELAVDAKMNEELKGDQHKIDANKNGKIDSHDFKLLKGKKKVEEELKGDQHKIDANKNGKVDAHDFKLLKHKKKMLESVKANMAQDSVDKIKKDPLASKEKIVLPATQGNKPVGGEEQVHTGKFSVAEETALNSLYESLSDKNKARFEEKMQTEEGIEELLMFAEEQGFLDVGN